MAGVMRERKVRSMGFYKMRLYDVRGGQSNGILEGVGGVSYRESGVIYGGDRQTGINLIFPPDIYNAQVHLLHYLLSQIARLLL
jgi:hypothetical protein